MNDSHVRGVDGELEEKVVREGRISFDRSSLDQYRASSPPSKMDELRTVIQQYAERNSLRLCRKGKLVIRRDGSSYRVACGSKWSCPQCSPQRLAEDQQRIERVLRSVPTVLHVTLTIAHEPGPPRAGSLDSILKTWSAAFTTGSWMPDFRVHSGLVGWVRSIEVTFPENGFHPHIHAAFAFTSKPRNEHQEALIQRWLGAAYGCGYRASYRAQKPRYVRSSIGRDKVAFYLCEQTAIRQARGSKGVTPGDLLHNVATTGDADDLNLLLGFHEAVAGKRKISTSRGFWGL